jgi:hypothetical protein
MKCFPEEIGYGLVFHSATLKVPDGFGSVSVNKLFEPGKKAEKTSGK